MMSNESEKKVGVFIDYENVHICLEKNKKAFKLDSFGSFRSETEKIGNIKMIKAIANWTFWKDQEKAFGDEGIQTLSIFSDLKNAADIALVVDCMAAVHDNKIDTVIIFSGDGGYAPLLNYLTNEGKDVYVFSVENGCNTKVYNRLKENHIIIDTVFKDQICDVSELHINQSLINLTSTLHASMKNKDFMSRKYFLTYLQNNATFKDEKKEKLGDLIDDCLRLSLINSSFRPNPHNVDNPTRTLNVNYEHPLIQPLNLK
jgi:uncharacterized protein (TIGR00288 family)